MKQRINNRADREYRTEKRDENVQLIKVFIRNKDEKKLPRDINNDNDDVNATARNE